MTDGLGILCSAMFEFHNIVTRTEWRVQRIHLSGPYFFVIFLFAGCTGGGGVDPLHCGCCSTTWPPPLGAVVAGCARALLIPHGGRPARGPAGSLASPQHTLYPIHGAIDVGHKGADDVPDVRDGGCHGRMGIPRLRGKDLCVRIEPQQNLAELLLRGRVVCHLGLVERGTMGIGAVAEFCKPPPAIAGGG